MNVFHGFVGNFEQVLPFESFSKWPECSGTNIRLIWYLGTHT